MAARRRLARRQTFCTVARTMLLPSLVLLLALPLSAGEPAPEPAFSPENARALDAFFQALKDAPKPGRRVATLDWDNTMMLNDIGDASMFLALRTNRLHAPVAGDWRAVYASLSNAAAAMLSTQCVPAATKDGMLDTVGHVACANTILDVYLKAKTADGADAFSTADSDTVHHPYAFGAAVFAGMTADQVRQLARDALKEGEAAPLDAVQTIGAHTGLPLALRIYPPMKALVNRLQQAGLDVWIVSASSQQLVEETAAQVGVAADHVLGVRHVLDKGSVLTGRLEGVGDVPDGKGSVITYKAGKRAFIRKHIFKLPAKDHLVRPEAEAQRAVFAAGDSDTDIAMLEDASMLRLVIDRQKPRLACHVLKGEKGWLLQPKFYQPVPPLTAAACDAIR